MLKFFIPVIIIKLAVILNFKNLLNILPNYFLNFNLLYFIIIKCFIKELNLKENAYDLINSFYIFLRKFLISLGFKYPKI